MSKFAIYLTAHTKVPRVSAGVGIDRGVRRSVKEFISHRTHSTLHTRPRRRDIEITILTCIRPKCVIRAFYDDWSTRRYLRKSYFKRKIKSQEHYFDGLGFRKLRVRGLYRANHFFSTQRPIKNHRFVDELSVTWLEDKPAVLVIGTR